MNVVFGFFNRVVKLIWNKLYVLSIKLNIVVSVVNIWIGVCFVLLSFLKYIGMCFFFVNVYIILEKFVILVWMVVNVINRVKYIVIYILFFFVFFDMSMVSDVIFLFFLYEWVFIVINDSMIYSFVI